MTNTIHYLLIALTKSGGLMNFSWKTSLFLSLIISAHATMDQSENPAGQEAHEAQQEDTASRRGVDSVTSEDVKLVTKQLEVINEVLKIKDENGQILNIPQDLKLDLGGKKYKVLMVASTGETAQSGKNPTNVVRILMCDSNHKNLDILSIQAKNFIGQSKPVGPSYRFIHGVVDLNDQCCYLSINYNPQTDVLPPNTKVKLARSADGAPKSK